MTTSPTLSQRNDFVYWATQYVKRKCIGVTIAQIDTEEGLTLQWCYGDDKPKRERNVSWSYEEQAKAFGAGAEALKQLIRSRVQEALPELFPAEAEAAK